MTIRHELRDFERFPIAPLLASASPRLHRQCVEVMGRTRAFAERHLAGRVERWDQEIGRDHGFVPWSVIEAGLPYGFLSMNVPAPFGGGGLGSVASSVFAEEIAAADAGVFVLFGAHGLAWALVLASLDLRIASRLGRAIVEGERRGAPVLLALAHTEPGGGSDVEDTEDINRARISSTFTRVRGGYRLRARKVFISNGSIARYNIVTAYEDPRRPAETMAAFIVPQDAAGFSVGRVERKLGQRLSTAAEVICDDVLVPREDVFEVPEGARALDTTLSLTRGPVAAMSAGIIRGTLERTLAYLEDRRVDGRWLYDEQWVQLALADMLGALAASRALYFEAALAGEQWGVSAALGWTPRVPTALIDRPLVRRILARPGLVAAAQRIYRRAVPDDRLRRLVAHSSIAKFVCSDLAVQTTMRAMEILGADATDPRWGVEKQMRDAKLAQIFEGTNQINRLHVTRGLLRRTA